MSRRIFVITCILAIVVVTTLLLLALKEPMEIEDTTLQKLTTAFSIIEQGKINEAPSKLNEVQKDISYEKEFLEFKENLYLCVDDVFEAISCSKQAFDAQDVNTSEAICENVLKYLDSFLAKLSLVQSSKFVEEKNLTSILMSLETFARDASDYKEEFESNAKNESFKAPEPLSLKGVKKTFTWKDQRGEHEIRLKISERRLKKYNEMSHELYSKEDLLKYVKAEDKLIEEIAQNFGGLEGEELANAVLNFVQRTPYVPEDKEYRRYPVETLMSGGDCEDKSVLFASIMKALGEDVALIYFKDADHVMGSVALKSPPKEVQSPKSIKEKEKLYYYCECTKEGWKVGELSESGSVFVLVVE